MDQKSQDNKKTRSFSWYLLFSMVILILFIVGFLTASAYLFTRDTFDRESRLLQIQTEENIKGAMQLRDAAWHIFDDSLNEKMRTGLTGVLQEYEYARGDPAQMDLYRLQNELGSDYDIYIISASGVIVKTTYGPELGTDFKTVPYFYDYLTKIRNREGFFPDRVVRELRGTGKLRKYAYMPTPDHQYILELGFSGQYFDQMDEELNDNASITQIVRTNPYIGNVRIFNSMGLSTDGNHPPEEPALTYISQAIRQRSDIEVQDLEYGRKLRYIFVDLKKDQYGSDTSRIVEITYNTRVIDDALFQLLLFYLFVSAAAILLGCLIGWFLSRRITRPIQEIAADADIIARGDLDHRLRAMENSEFSVLETSINTMVHSLNSAMQKLKDDAIFQKEMITQLPIGIFIKKAGDGRYIFWNTACEKLFHLPAAAVIAKTDRELFPSDIAAGIEREDRGLFLDRRDVRNKLISNHFFGEHNIHLIIIPIFDSGGMPQYILGIAEDVSHENASLKMDLLFSITRQDILDNLSVIMSHLERAQLKNTHADMQKFFDKTIDSVESIRNQISFMRALQELGLIAPKWQPVSQAFHDAARLLPENTANIHADAGDAEIFADPLLPRAFFILLDNTLRNSTTVPVIRLSARRDNADLIIVYEDNTPGVPPEEKEKLFEVGYDRRTYHGLFLVQELLSFTRILIRETGVYGTGVRFEIVVPRGKFRFSR